MQFSANESRLLTSAEELYEDAEVHHSYLIRAPLNCSSSGEARDALAEITEFGYGPETNVHHAALARVLYLQYAEQHGSDLAGGFDVVQTSPNFVPNRQML